MSTDNPGILSKKEFNAVPHLRADLLDRYSFLDALSERSVVLKPSGGFPVGNRFDLTV